MSDNTPFAEPPEQVTVNIDKPDQVICIKYNKITKTVDIVDELKLDQLKYLAKKYGIQSLSENDMRTALSMKLRNEDYIKYLRTKFVRQCEELFLYMILLIFVALFSGLLTCIFVR